LANASANSASRAHGYAQSASSSAQSASGYASQAQSSAQTASANAQDASQSATTASQKATESAQSANNAQTHANTAEQAKVDSQTEQGLAESARDSAISAKTDAESAKADAESARDEAVNAVASISGALDDKADIITDTASGAVASFTDGADDLPLKSLVVDINPIQDTSSGDPSPDNVCPISGWTGMQLNANGTTIPISWQSEAGTVYGGKLDVLTGILTVYPEYDSYNGEALTGKWISDRDVYIAGTTPTIGAQVVNIGAEGTEIQLEPHEIASLLGQNNIFADTGDTACEYRADTKAWVQRKIAEAISALS
jgi:hypothetical protein